MKDIFIDFQNKIFNPFPEYQRNYNKKSLKTFSDGKRLQITGSPVKIKIKERVPAFNLIV